MFDTNYYNNIIIILYQKGGVANQSVKKTRNKKIFASLLAIQEIR